MAGLGQDERVDLVDFVARNPTAGVLVKGTGGLRKLRWARPGAGKSGGFRVIYYFHSHDTPIYVFMAYGKGTQADMTPQQRKLASILVAEIKRTFRDEQKDGGT
jgi:hypothetical protein